MVGRPTATTGAVGLPESVYSAAAPSARQTRPPMVSRPWLVTVSSRTKRMTASPMSSRPPMLRGRLPKPMKARMMARAPSDAGHEVGVLELEEQAVEADHEQDEGDVGVGQQVQEALERAHRRLLDDRVRRLERDRRALRPGRSGRPSPPARAGRSAAMPSTRPSSTASRGRERGRVDGPRLTAGSTARPRASAMPVMNFTASFLTFSPSVPPMSSPWPPTGEAAPMLVPGAM